MFDSQCRPLVSLRVFGPLFRVRTAEIENSPPAFFFLYFIYGLLLRKSDNLPTSFYRTRHVRMRILAWRSLFFGDFGIVHFTQVL